MNVFLKILEVLKMPIRVVVLVAIVMGLLLFLPSAVLDRLQLSGFLHDFGKYVGILFVLSVGYVVVTYVPLLFRLIKAQIAKRKLVAQMDQVLTDLTWPERFLLREFFIQDKSVIEAPVQDTEVVSLYNKNIIQFASRHSRSFIFGTFVPITLNPVAKPRITAAVLGLPERKPTPKEIEQIRANRPAFLNGLDYVNGLMSRLRGW